MDPVVVHATERRTACRAILSRISPQLATITVVKLGSSYIRLLDNNKDRRAIFRHGGENPSFSTPGIAQLGANIKGVRTVMSDGKDTVTSLRAKHTIIVVDCDDVPEIAE